MTTITKVASTFYDPAVTFGRRAGSVSVVASSWIVNFSNGTKRKYNITLSLDNLDPNYDSVRDDPSRTIDDYFIQVDDNPQMFTNFNNASKELDKSKGSKDRKDFLVTPLVPSRSRIYYLISSQEFEKVSLKDHLMKTQLIETISREALKKTNHFLKEVEEEDITRTNPFTNRRIRDLNLTNQESKYFFHKLFEKHLISYIQKKDSSFTDGRLEAATETTPFFETNPSTSSSSAIKEFVAKMFCCGS